MTILLIIVTVLVSIATFPPSVGSIENMRRQDWFHKLKFNAYMVWHRKEWYRLFSSGLLHADWSHLIFNMITLYFFGKYVEEYCSMYFGKIGLLLYMSIYIIALAFSSIPSLLKHKNNHYYNAIGASGAVSAVLFASILFDPTIKVSLFFIPVFIPGYVFGPAYLAYCHYMGKRNMDNIGHDAHFWGAIFGFVFPILFKPLLIKYFFNTIF